MLWNAVTVLLALAIFVAIALTVRRLIARADDYDSEGKPSLEDLWTRGGGGDPGPGG